MIYHIVVSATDWKPCSFRSSNDVRCASMLRQVETEITPGKSPDEEHRGMDARALSGVMPNQQCLRRISFLKRGQF
jgi:hypothetical protein